MNRRSTKFGKEHAEIGNDLQFLLFFDETKLPQFGSISQIEIQFFIAYPPLNINRYLYQDQDESRLLQQSHPGGKDEIIPIQKEGMAGR